MRTQSALKMLFPVVLAMLGPCCDGAGPTASGQKSAPASAASSPGGRAMLSPRAEAVQIVCEGTAGPGTEDYQRVSERIDGLAEAKNDETMGVLKLCATRKGNSPDIRAQAVRVLARLGDGATARTVLHEMLRDRGPQMRLWHAHLLTTVGLMKAADLVADVAQTLVLTEEESLTMGLADVIETAVRVLVEFNTPDAWRAVEAALRDSRAPVREAVVRSLGRVFAIPAARERLLMALDDPNPDIHSLACMSLLYDPKDRHDRRPDLFKTDPCHPAQPAQWPAVAKSVRFAIATLADYKPPKHP